MIKKKILVTGCAGFIGSQFSRSCLKKYTVIGIDNLDSYYSVSLKRRRVKELLKYKNFKFFKIDIRNYKNLSKLINKYNFNYIFHFAAQAGVRYSKIDPEKYTSTNLLGTLNLLNCLKDKKKIEKIFLASSSSVYGECKKFPLKESTKLAPINHYAFTKKINEDMGYTFSKIYNMNLYMLRFFTVYGKWGRPDMFFFKLFKSVFDKKEFKLNNNGNHDRDFTYIDDNCEILLRLMNKKIKKKFDIYNICSNNPVNIKKIIIYINKHVTKNLNIKNIPRNVLDVKKTHGSNSKILGIIGKKKFTKYQEVVREIFNWYKANKIYKY